MSSEVRRRALKLVQRARYRSSTGNDRWICEEVFPGLRNGYFLEAGAADGLQDSSCHFLEAHLNWTGVCVEAHPCFAAPLFANRPGSRCFSLGLAETAGSMEFLVGEEATQMAFHTGIADSLLQCKSKAEAILQAGRPVSLPVLPLADVLEQAQAPAIIDYAAFDIEGSELRVLRDFPFERYRFRALSLECDWKIWPDITQLLEGNHYREVKNPFNREQPWERYWLSDRVTST